MTVANTAIKIREVGNGSKTDFDFSFKIFSKNDIVVQKLVRATDAATTLVVDVDYTVTLSTTTEGGTVVYAVAPTALEDSFIYRNITATQEADIPSNSIFREVQVVNALDKIVMVLQQVLEKLGRAITVPITSSLENVEVGDGEDAEAVISSAEAALVAAAAAELAAENAETSAAAAAASLAAVDATQIVSGTTKVTTNETPTKVKITTGGTLRATVDSDGLTLAAGASVNEFSTDGTLAGNSDDAVPTEKSVKTYIDTNASKSTVLFSFALGGADHVADANGLVVDDSITAADGSQQAAYWSSDVGSSLKTVIATKFIKTAGVSTVTIYGRIWNNSTASPGDRYATLKVNIGSTNGTVNGTVSQVTGEWKSFTIDVSGLTNGTIYDVTVQIAGAIDGIGFLDSIIAFGS